MTSEVQCDLVEWRKLIRCPRCHQIFTLAQYKELWGHYSTDEQCPACEARMNDHESFIICPHDYTVEQWHELSEAIDGKAT